MKILLINLPSADPESSPELIQALQDKGLAVLTAAGGDEAWQIVTMHASTLDLVVANREGDAGDASGIEFVTRIKGDATLAQLPVIVTSSKWGDAEFAAHQEGEDGANAYLAAPYGAADLIPIIEAVFGRSLDEAEAPVDAGIDLEVADETAAEPNALPLVAPGILVDETDDGTPDSAAGLPIDLEPVSPGKPIDLAMSSDLTPSPISLDASAGAVEDLPGEDVTGASGALTTLAPPAPAAAPPAKAPPAAPPTFKPAEIVAEDATSIFLRASDRKNPDNSVRLQPPRVQNDDFPEPGALTGMRSREQLEAASRIDSELERDLPYLARAGSRPDEPAPVPAAAPAGARATTGGALDAATQAAVQAALLAQRSAAAFFRPVTDAVIPGGTMHAPDAETLKKYLSLREQDVAVLTVQIKAAQDQLAALEKQVADEKGRNTDLESTLAEHRRKIDDNDREKSIAAEKSEADVNELRFQLKARRDKAKGLEAQVKDAQNEIERMKERVRSDIRKIRMREKELENKLEITRKDSEALLHARESKITELKRKLDLLEFNMDLLQDQHQREKETSAKLREKLAKAAQVVRVMGGLLDTNGNPTDSLDDGEGHSADGQNDETDTVAG